MFQIAFGTFGTGTVKHRRQPHHGIAHWVHDKDIVSCRPALWHRKPIAQGSSFNPCHHGSVFFQTLTQRGINVGLVIDTCHFYAGGSRIESIKRVNPEQILIFHINDVEKRPKQTIEDAHRLLPGEGVIPLEAILRELKATGFDGLCSIELFRPAYWERPAPELARSAREATLKLLGPLFDVV